MDLNERITIGIPVYNNEKFIRKHIESIFSQTYQQFRIIISNNGSTDRTSEICEELSKTYDRIIFFNHDKNRGAYWNFNFILKQVKTEYFVMAAPDDIWSKNFLESNMNILDKSKDFVGSIGNCSVFTRINNTGDNEIDIKHLDNQSKFQYVHPVEDNFKERIKFYLNFNMGAQYYSVFRTNDIQYANFFSNKKNYGIWQADLVTILKILKKGKLSVDTNSFFYKEVSSTSNSIIQYMRKMGFSKADILFSKIIFSNWFLREFGLKIYFQNFGNLIRYNLVWTNTVCGEVLRMIKRTVTGKEKYW